MQKSAYAVRTSFRCLLKKVDENFCWKLTFPFELFSYVSKNKIFNNFIFALGIDWDGEADIKFFSSLSFKKGSGVLGQRPKVFNATRAFLEV